MILTMDNKFLNINATRLTCTEQQALGQRYQQLVSLLQKLVTLLSMQIKSLEHVLFVTSYGKRNLW